MVLFPVIIISEDMEGNDSFRIIENTSDLPSQFQNLLSEARKSAAQAYAPYSGFHVGSAIMLDNGMIVIGANQENASFPLSMCAERVALYSKSMAWPEQKILAMAIFANSIHQTLSKPAAPCGACRQVMQEYVVRQSADFEIFLQTVTGPVYHFAGLEPLLPFGFKPGILMDQTSLRKK